jgi:hypothetical protein
MQLTPEQKQLEQIFHPYAAHQQATPFDLQTRFVHYTRAETAMCILRGKQIWMRKLMCMNDFMEVHYGLNRLFETYHRSEAGNRFKSVLDYIFNGLRTEIENLFDNWTWHLRTDTYFTCVSLCLLTAALAAKGTATMIGETEGGWFCLPPWSLWEPWAKQGLGSAEGKMASAHTKRQSQIK